MSKTNKTEFLIRANIQLYPQQQPFGPSFVVGADVEFTPRFTNGRQQYLECTLSNKRNVKLIYNYKLEFLAFLEESKPASKFYLKSMEALELEANEKCNLGFETHAFSEKLCHKGQMDVIFRFEFEDIQIPDVEPVTLRNSTWPNTLSCIYEDEEFKDITLKIGNDVLTAHRFVLITRSKVFYAMLQHDTKERREGVIEIKDSDVDSFKAFLKYCYTDKIEDLKNRAVGLLILADKYDVQCLKEACEDHLCKTTEKSNAIRHLIAAYLSNSNLLKATALIKIKPSVRELLKSQDSSSLNEYPLLLKEVMFMLDVKSTE